MKKILHTPEGVRDIYNAEYGKMLVLQERIQKMFHLYGYHDISTPTFEYMDVFGEDIGTTPSNDLYKFFDKDGNTLALRPDITPSIARASATLFSEEELPFRLCYSGHTFINHSNYQGRLREVMQMGAELIGDDSVEADAEMVTMVVESLLSVGLKEFQLNVSNVDFLKSLMDDAHLTEEENERVRELINNRNYFGLEEYLDQIEVKSSTREAFSSLSELVGGEEILSRAKNVAPNSDGVRSILRLEKLYQALTSYGVEDYVTFDLSMTGNYGYYTGIIFRGYTFGTGDAIVRGGRYDHLLEKFGKQSPSIGFAIVIDELQQAMNRQKLRIVYPRTNTIILYDEGCEKDAIDVAKDFRSQSKNAEMIKKEADRPLDAYLTYGEEYYANGLVYIEESGAITMIDLITDEKQTIEKKEKEE